MSSTLAAAAGTQSMPPFRSGSLTADEAAALMPVRRSSSPTRLPCVAHPVYTYHTACGCHRSPDVRAASGGRSASATKAGTASAPVPPLPPPPPPPQEAPGPAYPPYPAVPLTQFEGIIGRFGLLERPEQPAVVLCTESSLGGSSAGGGRLSCRSPITGELATFHSALSTLSGGKGAEATIVETLPSLPSFATSSAAPPGVSTAVWIGFSDGSVACYDSTKAPDGAAVAWGALPSARPTAAASSARSVSFEDATSSSSSSKANRGRAAASKPAAAAPKAQPLQLLGAAAGPSVAVTAIDRGGDNGTYSAHAHGAIYKWVVATTDAASAASSATQQLSLLPTLFVQLSPAASTRLATGTLLVPSAVHLLASAAGRGTVLTVWVLNGGFGEDGLPKHADLPLPKPPQGGRKQVGATLALEFSSSAEFLYSGHDDGRVLVWNVRFRTIVANLDLHRSGVSSLSAIGASMWTVSSAGECAVLDQETRIEMQRFPLFAASGGTGGAPAAASAVRLQRVAQTEGCIVWCTDSEQKVRAIFVPSVVTAWSKGIAGGGITANSSLPHKLRQDLDDRAGGLHVVSPPQHSSTYTAEDQERHRSVVEFELAERSAQVEEFLLKMAQLLDEKAALASTSCSGSGKEAQRTTTTNSSNDDDGGVTEGASRAQSDEIARLQEELVLLHERLHQAVKREERQLTEIALLQAEKEQSQMEATAAAAAAATPTATAHESTTVAGSAAAGAASAVAVYQDLVSRLEQENAELNDLVLSLQRQLAAAEANAGTEQHAPTIRPIAEDAVPVAVTPPSTTPTPPDGEAEPVAADNPTSTDAVSAADMDEEPTTASTTEPTESEAAPPVTPPPAPLDERHSEAADGTTLTLELEALRAELLQRTADVARLMDEMTQATARAASAERSIDDHVTENKQLVQQLTELSALLADRQPLSPPLSPEKPQQPEPQQELPQEASSRAVALAHAEATAAKQELADALQLLQSVEQDLHSATAASVAAAQSVTALEEALAAQQDELESRAAARARLEKALAREVDSKRALEAEIMRLNGTAAVANRSATADQTEALHERLQRQLREEREQFGQRLQEEEARCQELEMQLQKVTEALAAERASVSTMRERSSSTEKSQNESWQSVVAELEAKNAALTQQIEHRDAERRGTQMAHEQELHIAKGLLDEARCRPTAWPRSTQTELVETCDAQVLAADGVEDALRAELAQATARFDAADGQLDVLRLMGKDRVANEASVRVEYEERLTQLHKQLKEQALKMHSLQLVSTTNDALRERLVVLEGFERENGELRRRLRIADGEEVAVSVTAADHQALQLDNQDLRKQLQIHKHHITKLLENEIVMEKRLVAAMRGELQTGGGHRQQQRAATKPTGEGDSVSASTSAINGGGLSNRGGSHQRGAPAGSATSAAPSSARQQSRGTIAQLLQHIAPTGRQDHDPTDPHHRAECMWCSGRVQQSLGGSFGIFAPHNQHASPKSCSGARKSTSPLRPTSLSSSPVALTGTLGGALADEKLPERIAKLERARDATTNQRIRSAIVVELLALHKSVLPGDHL